MIGYAGAVLVLLVGAVCGACAWDLWMGRSQRYWTDEWEEQRKEEVREYIRRLDDRHG